MAGLVGYASSSDGDEDEVMVTSPEMDTPVVSVPEEKEAEQADTPVPEATSTAAPGPSIPPQISQPLPQPQASASAVVGPSLPPGMSAISDLPEPEDEDISAPPGSPYTVRRNLIRDLTLPTHPNLDIPPSPPGSPNPALNKKFDQFLDLKKKGIHFNSKLANSTALRNPALMDKLMDFIELGPNGDGKGLPSQYVTTLPADLWNPTGSAFPDWAFRGPLKESQDRVRKEHEAERAAGKRGVEFVRGTSSGTPGGSGGEAGGLSRGSKRKAGAP